LIEQRVILDASVLVALLSKGDRNHDWAVSQWTQVNPPALNCDAVISETYFLLKRRYLIEAVFEMIEVGAIAIAFNLQDEATNVRVLMGRYESVPMSFADACLVRMAEQIPNSAVMTLDSDFKIYRKHRNEAIAVVLP